jgi:hypothetical protein
MRACGDDHDVIVPFNLKSLGSCLQFSRSLDVGPGRVGIAGHYDPL